MLKNQETKDKNAEAARLRHRKLNRRERAFVANVHAGMTNEQAALKAGYPEASAKVRAVELMDDPQIQLMLHELAGSTVAEAAAITREYVLDRIRFTGEVATLRGQLASALRAWELLGRALGLFTDRVEVSPVEGLAERIAEARALLDGPKMLEAGQGNTQNDVMYRPSLPVSEIEADPTKLN